MNFNFKQGKELAHEQDILIEIYKRGESITNNTLDALKNNVWVAAAEKVAPNNLVIRQYCLIDLFTKAPKHNFKIFKMLSTLSYNSGLNNIIYGEGYSYYVYTLNILNAWLNKFDDPMISNLISRMDRGFISTSYKRGHLWYPAPFGDLSDHPLDLGLQQDHEVKFAVASNIKMNVSSCGDVAYLVKGRPLGLNTHIQLNDSFISIINGIPEGFKFYQGYDKKYKNKLEEFKDTFNIKRIKSI
jgi:hypothetical protein